MPNLILILTYKYPFEPPREQFLNDELKYYKNDDVCLIPCSWEISEKQIRKDYRKETIKTILFNRRKDFGFFASAFFSFFKTLFCYAKDKKACNDFSAKKSFEAYFKSFILSQLIKKEIYHKFDLGKYDKVIIYSYWLNTNAVIAYLLKSNLNKRNKNICAISRAHGQGDLFLCDYGGHVARPGIYALQGLNRIFTISDKGKTFLIEEGFSNVESSKLGTIGGRLPISKNSSNYFHIVSCSTVNENKNVLEIAKQILKLSFPVIWTHFGDGPLFEELVSFCSNNTNKNVVCDLKGNIDNASIKKRYALGDIDLFVNISTIEGIPVSIMEAMSYGIPCVGTNVGATSEIIVNDVNGFLIETNQIIELSKIINDFYALDPNKKNKLRENAYYFWQSNYNATKNYKQFVARINALNDK